MTLSCRVPSVEQLATIGRQLGQWQLPPWPGHLHPGDLGWHSMSGPDRTASDLRVWLDDEVPVAIGMLDGPGVFRMAVDPSLADDQHLAHGLARDVADDRAGLFVDGEAVVEARGARALVTELRARGWLDDEPWLPMTLDLAGVIDPTRLERAGLRVEQVGAEAAEVWTATHWSSFRGTPFDEESRTRFVQRWTQMMTGPFAERAHSLAGFDPAGEPVAVTTVWSAGPGRLGLVEPMGVHRDHHGKGYGVAITIAGALALQGEGASAVGVVAEASNPAAVATYRAAGFTSLGEVRDLRRP